MENFLVSLSVVFPIFIYLSIGYCLRLFKIFNETGSDQLNKSVFKLFLPASIFYNVYHTNIEDAFNLKLALYAVISIIIIFLIAVLVIPLIESDRKKIGPMIQMTFRSNFVIFGLPVASMLCKSSELGSVSLLIAIIVPVFNTLTVVAMEMFRGGKIKLGKTIKGIATNPLIISSVLGLICSALSFNIPKSIDSIVLSLANTSTPLALIALGSTFTFKSIKGYTKQIIIGLMSRLVIVPLILLTIAVFIGFRGADLVALMTMYASPVAVSSFIMAKQLEGDSVLAGHYVVLSATASIFTVFMWILILKNLMLI